MDHQPLKIPGILLASLFMFLAGLFAPASVPASTVQVEVIHGQDGYPAGRAFPLLFRLMSKPEGLSKFSTF